MNERIWDKFLTERDKAVFAAGGFGARAGFGKRPALLVIDVNWAFCGERPEPILESIKRWRTSCGEESWVALEYIKQLIKAARAKGLPVIYTTGERRPDNWDAGSWRWKSTRGDRSSSSSSIRASRLSWRTARPATARSRGQGHDAMIPIITSSQLPPAGEPCFRRCIAVASTPPKAHATPSIMPKSSCRRPLRRQTPDWDRRSAATDCGQRIPYPSRRPVKSP